ncbi:hypothetical protein [Nitratireductor sp. GCM10026969]|uniref:hypothetical protein n=1 Tax=Nitratireductor sp. GCM10026969 TaxID=3252645 RepID=UPI00360D66E6
MRTIRAPAIYCLTDNLYYVALHEIIRGLAMGKMKELQIEMMNLEFEWIYLLAAILGQVNVGDASVTKPEDWPSVEEEWEQIRFVPDCPASALMGPKRLNWEGRISGSS